MSHKYTKYKQTDILYFDTTHTFIRKFCFENQYIEKQAAAPNTMKKLSIFIISPLNTFSVDS